MSFAFDVVDTVRKEEPGLFDEELGRMVRQVDRGLAIGALGHPHEEIIDRPGADDAEHIGALVIGMGEVTHQAVSSA